MRYISAAVFALLVAASANAAPFGTSAHDKPLNDLSNVGRRSMRSYSYAPAQQAVNNQAATSAPASKPAPASTDSSSTTRRSVRSYSYQPVQQRSYEGNVSTGHLRADAKALGRF